MTEPTPAPEEAAAPNLPPVEATAEGTPAAPAASTDAPAATPPAPSKQAKKPSFYQVSTHSSLFQFHILNVCYLYFRQTLRKRVNSISV